MGEDGTQSLNYAIQVYAYAEKFCVYHTVLGFLHAEIHTKSSHKFVQKRETLRLESYPPKLNRTRLVAIL